jgi:hypothetical protein
MYPEIERLIAEDEGDNKMGQEQSPEYECALSQDVYSLIYIAPVTSVAFIYAVFVFCFQMVLMLLVLSDLINPESKDNPLSLPPGVPPSMTAAQGLCILLALAVQQDLIVAIATLQAGHSDHLTEDLPSATKFKFISPMP